MGLVARGIWTISFWALKGMVPLLSLTSTTILR